MMLIWRFRLVHDYFAGMHREGTRVLTVKAGEESDREELVERYSPLRRNAK
jgi:hypothetical protein